MATRRKVETKGAGDAEVDTVTTEVSEEVAPTPVEKVAPVPVDAPVEELSYEQARDELIAVVNRLESGGESLADSMDLFKRGEYLVSLCERYLTEVREAIETVKGD